MLVIFTENRTERFKFSVEFICSEFFGIEYALTYDIEEFRNCVGIKINYTNKDLPGWQIKPSVEIWEDHISEDFKPSYELKNGNILLFTQDSKIGFDPFAMAFWCLSRYEEYQDFEADKHGRFNACNLVFQIERFYRKPYLDIALINFGQQLDIDKKEAYQNLPTLDIDMAFMYSGKFISRRVTSWLRSKNKIKDLKYIFVNRPKEDPFAFEPVLTNVIKNKSQTRVFFLVGEYGMYDKNISWKYKPLRQLINVAEQICTIGLHPSYLGNEYPEKWKEEKRRIEEICNTKIEHSRQHYLKLEFGENSTYNQLLQLGIRHDYSMGFADDLGYRAGTGYSFNWFCLNTNKVKPLRIHPFCAMDVVLKNSLALNPEQALKQLNQLKKVAQDLKIPFSTLFHNESASGYGDWKGWDRIFAETIE